ncbi:Abca1 [Symbiodinium natans]|uniref:Abca1 protein n=1 Tax=Symbiodinium natans TaxID=878477 RepID=A0A812JS74_9DINO|nr:Abca1 [Symbiodinium natans]
MHMCELPRSSFLLISLTYSVNRMVTSVVHEREARLRDGMRMMGMHPAAFYVSWALTYVILYLFVVTGVVVILVAGKAV